MNEPRKMLLLPPYYQKEDFMFESTIWIALLITSFAGLSTGIGGLLPYFSKTTNTTLLSVALGFSAGVMIYVSFVDLFPQAHGLLTTGFPKHADFWMVIAFFGGIACIYLIDMLVPEAENPHEVHTAEEIQAAQTKQPLKRIGILMALAVSIHNFPEGMATFTSAMVAIDVAIPIAVAIAIHNIPEGIAVAMPIYYATGNRKKAFLASLFSGLAEPVGGLLGFLVLRPFLTPAVLGILLAAVAGIMVFISVDELLPNAEKYGKHHYSLGGFVGGMAIMALSLLVL